MLNIIVFLLTAVWISLSGVMAPGPVTAATLAQGRHSPYAGALIAVGHGIVEFPLMILIVLGMAELLKSAKTQIVIGAAGGVFLLWMALQMLQSIRKADDEAEKNYKTGSILTGIILSIGNPYFLLWWATVGLALATRATRLGVLAFALFAIVHWLCDLVWLEVLSWTSFRGLTLLGRRSYGIVLLICSAALFCFGIFFICSAAGALLKLQ